MATSAFPAPVPTVAAAPAAEKRPRVDLIDTPYGKSVIACTPITKGQAIYEFKGQIVDKPNMHTVQLDDTRHIICKGGPEFTAHSCDPNAYFAFSDDFCTLTAIRDIRVGELISFNYVTTEWDMSCKFDCQCGAANCFGQIRGFKHCTEAQREALRPYLSPYIAKKDREQRAAERKGDEQVQKRASEEENKMEISTPTLRACASPCASPARAGSTSSLSSSPAPPSPSITRLPVRFDDPSRVVAVPNDNLVISTKRYGSSNECGKCVRANKPLTKGTVLYTTFGTLSTEPDRYTVQLDEGLHLLTTGCAELTNHSCDPTGYFLVDAEHYCMSYVLARDVQQGDELTFNYNTTEWDMVERFKCRCGMSKCVGTISGFKNLTERQRAAIPTEQLSPIIRKKWAALTACESACSIVPARPLPFDDPRRIVRAINANVILSTKTFGSDTRLCQKCILAAKEFKKGTPIYTCQGTLSREADRYTVQLEDNLHLLTLGCAELTNHSCDPTGYFVIDAERKSMTYVAARDVRQGEELTFNYNTTEWDMIEKFNCCCGATRCQGLIAGFKNLTDEQKRNIPYEQLSPFLRKKFDGSNPLSKNAQIIEVKANNASRRCLVAATDLKAAQAIFTFDGTIVNAPSKNTLQIDESRHILCSGGVETVNHSCEPNAYAIVECDAKTPRLTLIALNDIKTHEPITINYLHSEWECRNEFECTCGSSHCLHTITGFKHLTSAQRKHLKSHCMMPYLRKRFAHMTAIDELKTVVEFKTLGPRCIIIDTPYGKAVVAGEYVPAGSKLYAFTGQIYNKPTMHTVQIDRTHHVNTVGGPEFTAHCCDPTCYMAYKDNVLAAIEPCTPSPVPKHKDNMQIGTLKDPTCVVVTALRDIAEGELVSFNYTATEWDMNDKFPCQCDTPNCQGSIQGFKHLSAHHQKRVAPQLSPYIRSLYLESEHQKARDKDKEKPQFIANGSSCSLTATASGASPSPSHSNDNSPSLTPAASPVALVLTPATLSASPSTTRLEDARSPTPSSIFMLSPAAPTATSLVDAHSLTPSLSVESLSSSAVSLTSAPAAKGVVATASHGVATTHSGAHED